MAARTDPPPGRGDGGGRRAATAHDVARLAGVSQSAVSRALTEGASASAETRRKVAEAAQALGYRPNRAARTLITRRSGIVGVAAPGLENQFYPRVLEALSRGFARGGHRLLLFSAGRDQPSDPVLEEVLRFGVDAVVLLSANLSSRFDAQCREAGIPVVLLNRRTAGGDTSSVTGDNRGGAALLAGFLVAGGHRRFGFMAGLEGASTSREREAGFTEALAARGLAAPLRAVGHYDFTAAAEATRALLRAPSPPDALFCANDHMALAAINVARAEFGLAVGRDISVVGFDDAGPAAWPLFDLTSYSQPAEAMAEAVVEITLARLADPSAPAECRVLPGRLAVRGSARRPSRGVVALADGSYWMP